MWLLGRVLTIACLLGFSIGTPQQTLKFAPPSGNGDAQNANNTNKLVFSSTTPQSSSPIIFAKDDDTLYDRSIFSTTANFYPDSYNRPPIFASAKSIQQLARSNGDPVTSSPMDAANNTKPIAPANKLPLGPPVFATLRAEASQRVPIDFNKHEEEYLKVLAKGAEEFGLEFLEKLSDAHKPMPHRSYMASPLSVWSLMVLLTEGAEDNTLKELRNTLRINNQTPYGLRVAYRKIKQRLNAVTNFVEVASYQAIFTDINKPVQRDFEDVIEREYQSVLTPVDFSDVNTTFVRINSEIDKATKGLLPYSILPQDLIDVQLLMISTLYFKGKWKYPFETINTQSLPFHDEEGQVTGNVQMMSQMGPFTYVFVPGIDSFVLELPYGQSNLMSMLVVFPRKGTKVNFVMNNLRNVGISAILQQLEEEERALEEEGIPNEVEVYLPRFTTESHFSLRYILENMGIIDVFQPHYANLTKIAKDVFVSSIFQSSRIIVNEDGTEAAALSVASLLNKASPVRFYLDRPFAYLIVEKTAQLLLFAGEIKSHA
ncbi:serine protease inhibitor 77Ba-like [Musca vetustissima]|uniref:serine protease inhibitor 77Ba-like n=1 Tax=Musca vetustissima TaxID=27455 RepID=UPI002AB7E4EE|nr:serine protease inhibitor 77Ba-like [Musca vetustissima]